MKVFAGNITPDTEHHIGDALGAVLNGAVDDDTDYDDVYIEAKFNIEDGRCFTSPGVVHLEINDQLGHEVEFIARADATTDEEGNVELAGRDELRYYIERK